MAIAILDLVNNKIRKPIDPERQIGCQQVIVAIVVV